MRRYFGVPKAHAHAQTSLKSGPAPVAVLVALLLQVACVGEQGPAVYQAFGGEGGVLRRMTDAVERAVRGIAAVREAREPRVAADALPRPVSVGLPTTRVAGALPAACGPWLLDLPPPVC